MQSDSFIYLSKFRVLDRAMLVPGFTLKVFPKYDLTSYASTVTQYVTAATPGRCAGYRRLKAQ